MKKALSLFIIFNSSVLLYAQCHFLLSLLILIRIEKETEDTSQLAIYE